MGNERLLFDDKNIVIFKTWVIKDFPFFDKKILIFKAWVTKDFSLMLRNNDF